MHVIFFMSKDVCESGIRVITVESEIYVKGELC